MKCDKHPSYQGQRPPRVECPTCWGIYHLKDAKTSNLDDVRKIRGLQDDKKSLKRTVNQLQEKLDEAEKLLVAQDSLHDIKRFAKIKPLTRKTVGEATAVALASDWHVEEIVEPRTIGGDNKHNPEIAKKRSQEFFQAIIKHVRRESSTIKINNLVLALMGDFITGNIHEENLENCAMRPMEAIKYAGELLLSGIDFLLNNTDLTLTVPLNVGNHSRITKKQRSATEQGNSLEMLMYSFLASHFKKESRITFIESGSYHTYVKVYNDLLRFHHGHAIGYAGGVGGLTIPAHKAIMRWNCQKHATLDLFGHHHQRWQTIHFISNGSQIGYNAFALSRSYEFDVPVQQFLLVDKLRGVTVRAPILYRD